MLAVKALIQKIPDPGLSNNERVRLRCRLAREFEKTGNFEAACGALDNLWVGLGVRPNLDMLDDSTTAEVLLRVGVLTGWIGNIRVVKGSQESARSLLTESIAIFETLGDVKKVAEAQTEMSLCWLREGSFDTARTLLIEALVQLDDTDGDLKALAVLRSAMLEMHYSRPKDAFKLLTKSASVFEASSYLKGPFHNQVAIALKRLGATGSQEDYVDSVLREYSASRFHLGQIGHTRYLGVVENNIAMFCLELGRFAEARAPRSRAGALHKNQRPHPSRRA